MIPRITINSSPSTSTITIKVRSRWNAKKSSFLKRKTLTMASSKTLGPRSPLVRKRLGTKTGVNNLFRRRTMTLPWNSRRKMVKTSKRNGSEKSGNGALTTMLRRSWKTKEIGKRNFKVLTEITIIGDRSLGRVPWLSKSSWRALRRMWSSIMTEPTGTRNSLLLKTILRDSVETSNMMVPL